MTYLILKFIHLLGTILIGLGLIGIWMSDLRSRQLHELNAFAEAVRNIAVFYDGVVVPRALLLLASGSWIIIEFYGGWDFHARSLVARNSRAFRLRVYRGKYSDPPLLHAATAHHARSFADRRDYTGAREGLGRRDSHFYPFP
jgi:hypothetical protein